MRRVVITGLGVVAPNGVGKDAFWSACQEIAPAVASACDEDGKLQVNRLSERGAQTVQPFWILKYLPNMVAAHISMAYNAQGPNSTITTACVAGTQAIGEAFRLVARGDADVMLAGGADSRIDPLMLLAYTALGALSRSERDPRQVSRPF